LTTSVGLIETEFHCSVKRAMGTSVEAAHVGSCPAESSRTMKLLELRVPPYESHAVSGDVPKPKNS